MSIPIQDDDDDDDDDNNNNNNNNNTLAIKIRVLTIVFMTKETLSLYLTLFITLHRARGGIVVKILRYKPTGRGFDSRWCHWNFSMT
jgi:cadmium resistance protein CadD (predicted permease)